MNEEKIILGLSAFLRGSTLDECPITILSREDIEGVSAELVWFQFGANKNDVCPAIVWDYEVIMTPKDWQCWDATDRHIEISEVQWMDYNHNECVIINGMPRVFF